MKPLAAGGGATTGGRTGGGGTGVGVAITTGGGGGGVDREQEALGTVRDGVGLRRGGDAPLAFEGVGLGGGGTVGCTDTDGHRAVGRLRDLGRRARGQAVDGLGAGGLGYLGDRGGRVRPLGIGRGGAGELLELVGQCLVDRDGVRLLEMPGAHRRMWKDFVYEKKRQRVNEILGGGAAAAGAGAFLGSVSRTF